MFWLLLLILPYLSLFLYIYSGLAGSDQDKPARQNLDKNEPFSLVNRARLITVIVALRDETANIPGLIDNLKEQTYPSISTEVIFIDDNSKDNTFKLVSESITTLQNFRVYKNNGTGKKDAIYTGIGLSSGELIVCTDADSSFTNNWLLSICHIWNSSDADLIIGLVAMKARSKFLDPFIQLEQCSVQGLTMGTALLGKPVMASGANLAFTRGITGEYKTYIRKDLASGDDMFLLHHAKRDGKKVVINHHHEGVVQTRFEGNLMSLLMQRARWSGKGIHYRDIETIIVGTVTALTNYAVFGAIIASIINYDLLKIAIPLLLLKAIPDILIITKMRSILGSVKLIKWYVPVALVHPFYVTIVTLLGVLYKPRWRA